MFTKFTRTSTGKSFLAQEFRSHAHFSTSQLQSQQYDYLAIKHADWFRRDTYCDQHTVEVQRFTPALFSTSSSSSQYLCQAPGVVDSQDVDVVLAAESLNEGEVDLQGHVFYVFVVGGEDAQDDIIRVPEEGRKSKTDAQSLQISSQNSVRTAREESSQHVHVCQRTCVRRQISCGQLSNFADITLYLHIE